MTKNLLATGWHLQLFPMETSNIQISLDIELSKKKIFRGYNKKIQGVLLLISICLCAANL